MLTVDVPVLQTLTGSGGTVAVARQVATTTGVSSFSLGELVVIMAWERSHRNNPEIPLKLSEWGSGGLQRSRRAHS
jgi:hypothetical protein